MKSLVITVFSSFLFFGAIFGEEKDCKAIPKCKVRDCCKLPEMADPKMIEEIVKKETAAGSTGYLKECKIKEDIFKALNLIKNDDIDEEAAMTYLDNQVKDAAWLKVVKDALKVCHKEMPQYYSEVQKRANFTQAQCDVRYDVVTDCIDIETFVECPEKSWIGKTGCDEGKKFVTDCKNNFEAMEKFAENQH